MSHDEIIAGPLELYLAPVGTAFPDLDVEPPSEWQLIGASGDKNYTEDGVSVNLGQSIDTFTPAGSTLPVKAFRTDESIEFSVTVADARAETLKHALNGNPVVDDNGDIAVSLLRGTNVTEYALLARGQSPYGDNGRGQFQVPRCFQSAEPELAHQKGEPVGVELQFDTLDPGDAANDLKAVYEDVATS